MDARRRTAITALSVAAVLLAGVVVFAVTSADRSGAGDEAPPPITPAEVTLEPTRSVVATYAPPDVGAGEPGSSPDGPQTGDAGSGRSAPGGPTVERSPLVAYRRDGWLCVVAEDGSGERRVAQAAGGAFALSPDGRALAWVEDDAGVLRVCDVASGVVVETGPALPGWPSWAADSSALVYTAPGPVVMRVPRDGDREQRLFAGSRPTYAADSADVVVGASADGDGSRVVVWRGGSTTRFGAQGRVTGIAAAGDALCVALASSDGEAPAIQVLDARDGTVRGRFGRPSTDRAVAVTSLMPSPDGRWLAWTESGDDGYSRLFVARTGSAEVHALAGRRDCVPLGWSADGTALLAIEGNAFQGELTRLVSIGVPDGVRRTVAEGAGL